MTRKARGGAGKPGTRMAERSGFALAVEHHQAGRLGEAEMLYRQVLMAEPRHFATLHHLGILALQRGQPQSALEPLGRAIDVDSRVAECRYNMAFALQAVGRLEEASEHYRAVIALKPDYLEAHTNLGNVLTQLGDHRGAALYYERVASRRPSAEAHYNLGNALAALARNAEAVDQYRRALALKPDLAPAHNNLANTLVAQRHTQDALEHFARALALDPKLVEAHINFGAALIELGRLDAAVEQLQRALAANPQSAAAHSNLGNVRLAQGRLEEAAQCYHRALECDRHSAEAHNNLGIVLMARGDLPGAIQRFELALVSKPDFVDACNNLARALMATGQAGSALAALHRAIAIGPSSATKALFVQCVCALPTLPSSEDFRGLMIRALQEPWGRGNDLARAAGRLLMQDPSIAQCAARAAAAWPGRLPAEDLFGAGGLRPLAANELLRSLLQTAAICDSGLERLATAMRAAMLELATDETPGGLKEQERANVLELGCALAQQCFLNDYVFDVGPEEVVGAQRLRDRLVDSLGARQEIAELDLAMVASYFPLHALPAASLLLERSWSPAALDLVVQQVREPLEEEELKAALPVLIAIDDQVSQAVRQQYEENPYPRWRKADLASEALPFDRYLRRRLPAAAFAPLGKPEIDVLIAGCGTGQHSIETARRFEGANVLALDLSRSSLAYAKRQSLALGISNISYGQADILKLAALGRSFDVIESSGVLHHLADPFAGWRVLTGLLRPGGFVTIGLYSEIARAGLAVAREYIAARRFAPTSVDIRQCRQEMLAQGERFADVIASVDFFSTSACRDLLFHVHEQRLTLPQIAAFLEGNGLVFVGFDIDPGTAQSYLARFPQDTTMTDLALWDRFERDNPATFSGMYQFWVQKL